MRKIFVLSLLLAISSAAVGAAGGAVTSFYELKTKSLDGKPADLATYRGTVSLVVNVASYCGYTPQYAGLEKLQREMKGKGFNVLGFPSNDFGEQEPGTAERDRHVVGDAAVKQDREKGLEGKRQPCEERKHGLKPTIVLI